MEQLNVVWPFSRQAIKVVNLSVKRVFWMYCSILILGEKSIIE